MDARQAPAGAGAPTYRSSSATRTTSWSWSPAARRDADALWDEVAAVLAPMGLRLSADKTRVCHIDEGFDFLGWHIQRQRRSRGTASKAVYTYPSKKALPRSSAKVRQLTRRSQAPDARRPAAPAQPGAAGLVHLLPARRVHAHLRLPRPLRLLAHRRLAAQTSRPGLNVHTVIRRLRPRMEDQRRKDRDVPTRAGHHRALPLPGHPASRHPWRSPAHNTGMTTWRAGCSGTGTSGSGGGPQKRTSRKTGTAPRPDLTPSTPPGKGRCSAAASWTASAARSSAGPSTQRRTPRSSSTPWTWPSETAGPQPAASCTPITASSSPPGPSARRSAPPGSCPRSARSATGWTTP